MLSAIDPALAYPKNLVKVLLALKSPVDLLVDSNSRLILLDLLPRDQAPILASLLGANDRDNPYAFFANVAFTRKSHQKALFTFLGVGIPEEPEKAIGPSDTRLDAAYPLFPHQITALLEVRAKLFAEPHRVLLHMPTGAGKTRTAMNVIVDHLRDREAAVVVWLAHSEELCQQAV